MKVKVQYKKGFKLGRAETDEFDADQIVRTADGRIEMLRDGDYVGEVKAGVWDSVIIVEDE
jgi:hypothetical protein